MNRLRADGSTVALIPNGSAATSAQMLRFVLAPYFDLILIEGEIGIGKPDERVFLHALRQLGAVHDETAMVGDDLSTDIAGAQRVGIRGVWIDVLARTAY